MGEWVCVDIFYGWVGVGGSGLWYFSGGCAWVDIFYGWMGVGEGIFRVDVGRWTIFMGKWVALKV